MKKGQPLTKSASKRQERRETNRKSRATLIYLGSDSAHDRLYEIDGTMQQTPEEKFATICQLSLFHYQLIKGTHDIPRLLRTTARIRKA